MSTVVTKAVGGHALPLGLLYVDPAQVAVDPAASGLIDTGLDPAFVADLSERLPGPRALRRAPVPLGCGTHDRCRAT